MSDQFLSELNLWCLSRQEAIAATGNANCPYFQLITPLQYRSTLLGGIIEIPKDFLTDLGSIPRAVWWWLSPDDYDISYPSTVHDYIYKQKQSIGDGELFLSHKSSSDSKGRHEHAATPTKTGNPRNSRSCFARSNGRSRRIELPARCRLQCRPNFWPPLVTRG